MFSVVHLYIRVTEHNEIMFPNMEPPDHCLSQDNNSLHHGDGHNNVRMLGTTRACQEAIGQTRAGNNETIRTDETCKCIVSMGLGPPR